MYILRGGRTTLVHTLGGTDNLNIYFGGGTDHLYIYFGGGTDNRNMYFRGGGTDNLLSNTITKPNLNKDLGAHLLRMRAIFLVLVELEMTSKKFKTLELSKVFVPAPPTTSSKA